MNLKTYTINTLFYVISSLEKMNHLLTENERQNSLRIYNRLEENLKNLFKIKDFKEYMSKGRNLFIELDKDIKKFLDEKKNNPDEFLRILIGILNFGINNKNPRINKFMNLYMNKAETKGYKINPNNDIELLSNL